MTTITIPSGPLQGVQLQVTQRRLPRMRAFLRAAGLQRRTRAVPEPPGR